MIPNGYQEESALARPVFRRLTRNSNIYLAYVSGRDKKLIKEAIEEYDLPVPDYAIGDVGTTLYRVTNGHWHLSEDWNLEIGQDWKGFGWEKLAALLEDMQEMQLQEPEKQNQYKLSFYTDQKIDSPRLKENICSRLAKQGIRAGVIWSIDEMRKIGLLDIIPARTNKLYAIQFLISQEQFSENRTVFAGDSGNDLDVLTGGLQAILVKNAAEDVRKEAVNRLSQKHMRNRLYMPMGNFLGMNGNYAAGVLEGLAHFIPETEKLIADAVDHIK